jgi:hypothetical protein
MKETRISKVAAASSQAGPGVPLELAVMIIRIVEFGLALGSGFLTITLLDLGLDGATAAVYGRTILLGGLCFALLSETMGAYDLDAQFSLRTLWRRLAGS